ncbi:hypothetical protein [Halorubellus litoreus]|uniref:Uncharacterized protein n=1 Tax=Halorubellus litoreus TaxID=755308 RepID=A0ABD5VDB3_9EURY
MPTLKRYANKRGYYIHANIGQSVVTFQVTGRAATIFEEIGYSDGSTVSWEMISQLRDRGDIYTKKSGVDYQEPNTESGGLSEKEKQVLEKYSLKRNLSNPDLVRGAIAEQTGFSKSSEEVNRIIQSISRTDHNHALYSIQAFQNVPYELLWVSTNANSIIYEFSIEEDISLTISDDRWKPDSSSGFSGTVEYPDESISFAVYDGYITRWDSSAGDSGENWSEPEENHKEAIKSDTLKSGLGFNVSNWTELLRKCFIYIENYDIRPYNKGHRGLASLSELVGKHLWMRPTSTTVSSKNRARGAGSLVETKEMKEFVIRDVDSSDWVFVEVLEGEDGGFKKNNGGVAIAEPIEFVGGR